MGLGDTTGLAFLNRVSEVRVLPGYHFFQFRSIEFANQFP